MRDEGYDRFADRFDRILGKALDAIPMAETSVDGCSNLWAPFSEADDAWDPATGTRNNRRLNQPFYFSDKVPVRSKSSPILSSMDQEQPLP